MTKRNIRSMMIGFCVFILALIIVYFIYTTAYKINRDTAAEPLSPIEQTVTANSQSNIPAPNTNYIARIDGDALAIYLCTDSGEEFLYTLDVRLEDIGDEERLQLTNGIILNGKQALASFEEDFTG